MPLLKLLKKIATHYDAGEQHHVTTLKEAENCGDTLLLFLFKEAHDAKGDEPEFIGMLATARDQLDALLSDMQK